MAERLTWEEITERYPDEWVIVVDIDDDQSDSFLLARVVQHSADRDFIEREFRQLGVSSGLFFTGQLSDLPVALSL